MHPALASAPVARLMWAVGALLLVGPSAPGIAREAARVSVQDQTPTHRDVGVSARKYAFAPDRIEVQQDDLVKVTFTTADIAHSFTIDAYRIARRVGPGQSTVFEFRADKPGTFPYYCNLAADDGCRRMRGELVVKAR